MRHQYLWFLLFFFLQRYLWSWQKKKKILGKKPNFFDRNDWEGRLAVDNQTLFFSCLMDQNSQNIVLTNNSRTAWPSFSNSYVIFEILGQFYRCILFFKSEWSGGSVGCGQSNFFFFCLYYGSKQSKYCFDQLKNCLTYLNFNTIFEILGQFSIRCIRYIIFKKVLTILR